LGYIRLALIKKTLLWVTPAFRRCLTARARQGAGMTTNELIFLEDLNYANEFCSHGLDQLKPSNSLFSSESELFPKISPKTLS